MGTKVWVIPDRSSGPRTTAGPDQSYAEIHDRIVQSRAGQDKTGTKGGAATDARKTEEQGSPAFAAFAYVLGPLSIFATNHGRQSRFWIALAVASVVILEFIALRARSLFSNPEGAGASYAIWCIVAMIMTAAAFASWARGVALLGARRGWLLRRLPAWVRERGAAAMLGLLIPGYGLYVAGHSRRAVAALLGACAFVASLIALHFAPGLWRWNQETGAFHDGALERVFISAACLGLVGALSWVFQWLDGARLAGYRTGRDDGMPGDWSALLLLIAIALGVATFHPGKAAHSLDGFAVSAEERGLELVPLYASEAAMRLDPSEPAYALRAAAMNERAGRGDEARAIRQKLVTRWKNYEMMTKGTSGTLGGPQR